MALPASFLEELRARSPLSELIGRRVRLARSGRQWKGCCPFHDEKTPSFHVYDDHFHCFGCGAHGDAITFVMQSQGLGFTEAVEQLATASGLTMPQPSPEVVAAEQVRQDLFSVLEAAARAFARRLFLPEGKAALAYLTGRGLSLETIRAFGLGWSGEGRGALAAELGREGIPPARLAAAGLLKEASESKYSEFFFNRVMFPIRDSRGRVVSFGGRVLGEGQPKYLNGPETEVFSKRRGLYGLDRARNHLGKSDPPIVVEGYMDVIALHQAGFPTAVAPLGTALTEEQLALLWRQAEVPVICFDGDEAGARAAARAIELALPLVGPGRTLAFARLPKGEDPDSFVRKHGAEALRRTATAAEPLYKMLFTLLSELAQHRPAAQEDPQRRGILQRLIDDYTRRITDRALAWEYRRSLRDLYFAGQRRQPGPGRQPASVGPIDAGRSALDTLASEAVTRRREEILLAVLVHYPWLLPEIEEDLPQLSLTPRADALWKAISQWWAEALELDSANLMSHLSAVGLTAEAAGVPKLSPAQMPSSTPEGRLVEIRILWRQIFGSLVHQPRLKEELNAALRACVEDPSPENDRRLIATKRALDALCRGEPEAAAEGWAE